MKSGLNWLKKLGLNSMEITVVLTEDLLETVSMTWLGLLLFIIELEKKLNGKNGNIFYGSNCLTEKNKISLCVLVPIQEKINSETILKEILNLEMVFSILMPIPS